MSVTWFTSGTSTAVTYPSIGTNGSYGTLYNSTATSNIITNSVNSMIALMQQNDITQDTLERIIGEMAVYYGVTDHKDIASAMMKSYGVNTKEKKLTLNHGWEIVSNNGIVVSLDDKGNIKVDDSNAKVVYRSNNIRDFNKYLNASDLIEQFIRFTGTFGVRQSEVLNIPIETFINWLIIEAAKMDGEAPPDLPLIEKKKIENRCACCGKFIKKSVSVMAKFCNPEHYQLYLNKNGLSST